MLNPMKEKLQFKKVCYKNVSYQNAKIFKAIYTKGIRSMKIIGPNYITKVHTKKKKKGTRSH